MKKLLIFIFGLLFSAQSFATSIDSGATSAPCDNDILGQTSGTVNMEIDWQPNTINVRWYNNNTQITPTNNAANTCTYGGDLYLPNAPTKKGYTFEGWEVRPQYDFSLLNTSIAGNYAWSKNSPGSCWGGSGNTGPMSCTNDTFNDLGYYEWKTLFNYGTIYGAAMCSSTSSANVGDIGYPEESNNGVYCWCKATGFIPTNSDIKYSQMKSPKWAYIRTLNSYTDHCKKQCADWCSAMIISANGTSVNLRTSLFK